MAVEGLQTSPYPCSHTWHFLKKAKLFRSVKILVLYDISMVLW
nr:MAG TPA: hypothetical protein [Caudoviricetes sp.]